MDKTGGSFLVATIFLNAAGNILIKAGMSHQRDLLSGDLSRALSQIIINPYALSGILCFGASFLSFSAALSRIDLSVAYPVTTGLCFVLVLLASIFYFRETISSFRVLGITAIAFGIALISIKG